MNLLRRFRTFSWLLLAALSLAAQAQHQISKQHVGRVNDWSHRHVVVSGGLSDANLEAAKTEPRILFHLAERNLVRIQDGAVSFPSAAVEAEKKSLAIRKARPKIIDGTNVNNMKKRNLKRDWSVSLGTGNVAQSKYPAKFSFDINAAPSCANDFVVYGLNVAGVNGGQANVVGLNNLYSGTAATGGTSCTGHTTATVTWAYNGSTAGGRVLTSPTISLNGTKIAYVESAAGSSIFHVLTVLAGQGTVTGSVAPTVPSACTVNASGTPTSSCLKSRTYSSTATTTLADPWVDYRTDKAFVASDDGKIYRISCVFTCALNAQPTVDWTYTLPVAGTGGAQPVPNGPVYDYPSGRLFVGDQLGELWVINAGGTTPTLAAGPVMVGGGGCTTAHPPGRTGTGADCTGSGTANTWGIPDSIILDASSGSHKIYAFSGNDGTAGARAVVAQLAMNLTAKVSVHVGQGGVNLYSGAFDNEYWGATPATGELFLCGTGPADTTPTHYWIGFTSYPTMNSTPTGSLQRIAVAGIPCAPETEFYNPNLNLNGVAGNHDLLMGGLIAANPNGYMITNDISGGTVIVALNFTQYAGGVSGIIIDNVSLNVQASSMYFATLTSNQAIKLTQLNSN